MKMNGNNLNTNNMISTDYNIFNAPENIVRLRSTFGTYLEEQFDYLYFDFIEGELRGVKISNDYNRIVTNELEPIKGECKAQYHLLYRVRTDGVTHQNILYWSKAFMDEERLWNEFYVDVPIDYFDELISNSSEPLKIDTIEPLDINRHISALKGIDAVPTIELELINPEEGTYKITSALSNRVNQFGILQLNDAEYNVSPFFSYYLGYNLEINDDKLLEIYGDGTVLDRITLSLHDFVDFVEYYGLNLSNSVTYTGFNFI